ncbi:MAG TPA: hypothetical protein VM939_08615 [Gemmatimonadaceae bacterium]|nr:hypothetical protein [Gemmatimonadaceae bacterium]
MRSRERLLVTAGVLTGIASLLHVAIIFGGPDWYRFFGAGERMARLAGSGSMYPTVITSAIAVILGIWMLYALSGARVICPLPLLRLALTIIAAIYLIRGIFGVPFALFVDDPYANQLRAKMTFMVLSSGICIFLGFCYVVGASLVSQRSTSRS